MSRDAAAEVSAKAVPAMPLWRSEAVFDWLDELRAAGVVHGFTLCQNLARLDAERRVSHWTDARCDAEAILRRLEADGVIRRGEPRWSGDIAQLGDLIMAGSWRQVQKHLKNMPDQPMHYVWHLGDVDWRAIPVTSPEMSASRIKVRPGQTRTAVYVDADVADDIDAEAKRIGLSRGTLVNLAWRFARREMAAIEPEPEATACSPLSRAEQLVLVL